MSLLAHFADLPLSVTPQKKKTLSAKEKVLAKLDDDLKAIGNISDVDDLGYGTALFPYKNKSGKKVMGRMKSWSGSVNANGKREVRMVLGTAIAFADGDRLQIEVENTVDAVTKGLKMLRNKADAVDHSVWEEVSTQMAKVNQMKRERKEANKRK